MCFVSWRTYMPFGQEYAAFVTRCYSKQGGGYLPFFPRSAKGKVYGDEKDDPFAGVCRDSSASGMRGGPGRKLAGGSWTGGATGTSAGSPRGNPGRGGRHSLV